MPKSTSELAASKAGETAETNGFGSQERPLRPAGVYQLKNKAGEVVSTIIVKNHPKFGDGQAAAAQRVGYEYVRPARKDEVKEIEVDSKQLATEDKAGNVTQDDLKGLQARLNALEKENADLKAGKTAEDTKGAADGEVKAQAKADAKEEAAKQLEARDQAGPLENAPTEEAGNASTDEAKTEEAPAAEETPAKAESNTKTNAKKESK